MTKSIDATVSPVPKRKFSLLKKILLTLAVIIVAFLGFIAIQPANFRIERGISINAAPKIVFAQVNDFHKWDAWSPWAKLDPNAKTTFGQSAGIGATLKWAGNKEVGEGSMRIVESRPNDLVQIKLEFLKPFEATNTAEFTFKPEGNQTVVTWSMFGKNNFMAKAVRLFMDCDKMVGDQFEKGLAQMKLVAEAAAH